MHTPFVRIKSARLFKLTLSLVCACLAISAGGVASAAAPKKASKTFEPTVKAVTATTITVTTGRQAGLRASVEDDKGNQIAQGAANVKVYKLRPETTITVDGLPSKISDVKPGMKVVVGQGIDPSIADSIVANTVPPAAPVEKAAAKPAAKGKGKPFATKPFGKIAGQKVISITKDRITVGSPGADKAVAYFIGPMTSVTVNGETSPINEVRPGMEVVVDSTDGTTASSITAQDSKL